MTTLATFIGKTVICFFFWMVSGGLVSSVFEKEEYENWIFVITGAIALITLVVW